MISILKLDKETRLEIIKDLFNEIEPANLVPYGGASNYRADLWQNIDSNRIIIKIEDNIEINDFELIHDAYERYESIINTEPPLHFILIVLRNIPQETKNRLKERFGRSKAKKTSIFGLDDLENFLSKNPKIENKYTYILNTWHEAYSNVAEVLNDFYIKLIEKQKKEPNLVAHKEPAISLYRKLEKTEYYNYNSGRLFHNELRLTEKGLDPIQIFATFNYSGIKNETRIVNINLLLQEFRSNKRLGSDILFDGIPAPIITQIIQYRGWKSQNEIWDMFNIISQNGIIGLTDVHFKSIKNWRGIDIPSFTMFLFWVNSKEFIPLDVNTVKYLKDIEIIKTRPKNYKIYNELCLEKNKILAKNPEGNINNVIRNVVREAYLYNQKNEKNEPSTDSFSISGSTQTFITTVTGKKVGKTDQEKKLAKKRKEQFKNFKILAIRPKIKENRVNETDKQDHLKNLKEGEIYQFYKAYKFTDPDDNEIEYDSSLDPEIYNEGNLNIAISAVVGMNGSGKSTIADFIYLIINRISLAKKIKSTHKLKDEPVYADLFIKSDRFYKISVGENIRVYIYDFDERNNKYINTTKENKSRTAFKEFDVESLCYSIVINYSLYGLNSNIVGEWINPLFHKNDSYQVPIVLNPKRDNGRIDVNIEDELAKSRLLSNLLEPSLIDFDKKIVPALIQGAVPKKLNLKLDLQKLKEKRKKHKKILDQEKIEQVINAFNLNIRDNVEFLDEAKEHIYLKTISIAYNYPQYKDYKKLPEWINDKAKLGEYLKKLVDETSHITFKLKQSINYLIYDLYNTSRENDVINLSEKISDLQKSNTGDHELRTIDLIPPSFLKTNVFFEHGGSFDSLSSGEKQQIYSINTIAYHLYNLKTVMVYENIYKYNSVNIIFDEVELYFHPDMQRKYIYNLRERIISLDLNRNNDINNINIIFITHSPFILSDIPNANVLMLKLDKRTGKSLPIENKYESFGANVHDLLANEFFMENGFMGEFVKEQIVDLSNQLTKETLISEEQLDVYEKIIKLIGEPIIRNTLLDLLKQKRTENDIN